MRLNRWSNPDALDALSKKIDNGLQAIAVEEKAPCTNCNGKAHHTPLPRYEWHKPIMVRLFGTGCSTCGSKGWVQRQVETPRRIVRFFSWSVTLLPRAWSMFKTVLSRKVDPGAYFARMKICHDNSFGSNACAVRFLRHTRSGIVETFHCGLCNCPKLPWASLRRKNYKQGWKCPKGLHVDSQPDKEYTDYIQVRVAEIEAAKVPVEN